MQKSYLILSAALFLASASGYAQDPSDCTIHYTRTACPGKEAESYKKCDGQQSCAKPAPASSEKACQEAALKACANDRLDITHSKVITATYKGKPIKSTTGKDDFCADYAKRKTEFDRCSATK
ncbi:hypothetical protein OOT46_07720 [Aquabacterium sp. A7-Y]|uniref:hypothetical protein n=1 Tax=Aquabacterium sp. A7-Y TaxID=1349605 RepID=UPI00223D1707|nr:hypothetical protein [Aquabacterium sp. A7-Y]MCW7537737.1 hypothetical protein [Aquabacterium sp. A7-Y]